MTYCSVGNAGHLKDFHVRKLSARPKLLGIMIFQ